MKRLMIIILLGIFAGSFKMAYAQAPSLSKVIASKKMDPAKKANNPNIKMGKPTTDIEIPKPEKVRGGCDITFNNKTGYYIDIYVDGNYKSTLAPWESCEVSYTSGYSSVYCVTVGGTYDWSANGTCEYHYNYDLN